MEMPRWQAETSSLVHNTQFLKLPKTPMYFSTSRAVLTLLQDLCIEGRRYRIYINAERLPRDMSAVEKERHSRKISIFKCELAKMDSRNWRSRIIRTYIEFLKI
jgi:hypothetical protein